MWIIPLITFRCLHLVYPYVSHMSCSDCKWSHSGFLQNAITHHPRNNILDTPCMSGLHNKHRVHAGVHKYYTSCLRTNSSFLTSVCFACLCYASCLFSNPAILAITHLHSLHNKKRVYKSPPLVVRWGSVLHPTVLKLSCAIE